MRRGARCQPLSRRYARLERRNRKEQRRHAGSFSPGAHILTALQGQGMDMYRAPFFLFTLRFSAGGMYKLRNKCTIRSVYSPIARRDHAAAADSTEDPITVDGGLPSSVFCSPVMASTFSPSVTVRRYVPAPVRLILPQFVVGHGSCPRAGRLDGVRRPPPPLLLRLLVTTGWRL